ncbi:hypothetical protein PENSPDRAFT_647976, partial [Peniophora sp. CONT]
MAAPLTAFHDAVIPYHTHAQCACCKQMRRCAPTGEVTLARCKGCLLALYCDKECQIRAWKGGHKNECRQWTQYKTIANEAAGHTRAWMEFARWREYHHDTLTNAALANIILNGDGSEDEHTLVAYLKYDDDPSKPLERKFRVTSSRFIHMSQNEPDFYIEPFRPLIIEMLLTRKMGLRDLRSRSNRSQSARMATYMLITTFGEPDADGPGRARHVPYYRIFGYDTDNLRAKVTGPPEPVLNVIVNNGLKQRFCCGKLSGTSTCCCGGWTHEQRNGED